MATRGRGRTDRDTLPLRQGGGRDGGGRDIGSDDGGRPAPPSRSPLGTATRVAVIAACVVVILAGVLGVAWVGGLRDSIRNPFATREIDRSQPALLTAIEDLNVFKAATGNFRDIVDLEKDAPFLPQALKGERTLFVAAGTVDAEVDFSKLSGDAIKVSDDRTSVEIVLNHPTLARPQVDPKLSYVVDRQRGLIDRLESVFQDNPTSERELYAAAEAKLAQAAQESQLAKHAEDNTRGMLTSLMKSLGFTNVKVTFVDAPPGGGADN